MSNNTFPNPRVETYETEVKPKKKKRVFMWFFLAVQALFILWIVTGVSATSDTGARDCGTLDAQTCADAAAVGTGLGVALIIGLWLAVDFILGIGYLIKVVATKNR